MRLHNDTIKGMRPMLLTALAMIMILTSTAVNNAHAAEVGDSSVVGINSDGSELQLISADLALNSIKAADREGADTLLLIDRYNEGLRLLDSAQDPESSQCGTYDDCRNQVDNIFVSITADAVVLKDQARGALIQQLIISGISAAGGAFLIAFLGLYFYRAWTKFQIKHFLAMEIQEAEDRFQ